MRPNFPMINAATPDTAGVAMLVPAAHAYEFMALPDPRWGARTRSNTQHGTVMKPAGFTGFVQGADRKSTRLNSSHTVISYAVFCLKKKKKKNSDMHARSRSVQ